MIWIIIYGAKSRQIGIGLSVIRKSQHRFKVKDGKKLTAFLSLSLN